MLSIEVEETQLHLNNRKRALLARPGVHGVMALPGSFSGCLSSHPLEVTAPNIHSQGLETPVTRGNVISVGQSKVPGWSGWCVGPQVCSR